MNLNEDKIVRLREFCDKYKVERLYLFGSVLKDSFSVNSDMDFLVKFKDIELKNYFSNYMSFKESLKTLFDRDIDLVEEQSLKNPILIQSINKTKELVYG